jgi:predicted XRE-type DNA-binding protein
VRRTGRRSLAWAEIILPIGWILPFLSVVAGHNPYSRFAATRRDAMMTDEKSTIRSRELGDALRLAMERAVLSGRRAAQLLGWSESRVSRLLTGQISVKEVDVASFLAVCMVTGAERDRLLALAREHNTLGWLQQYGSGLPEQLRTLINHEARATDIHQFEALRVPGLLQTGDYARALIERVATVPPEEVEGRVSARMGRQKTLFSRDPRLQFTFFLHELVFRLPVGGREVMSEQMHHLLQMSVRSYITIRVIPAAYGAHAGTSGACRLMESAEFKPVVYVEEETAGHFMEDPDQIASYRKVFAALASCALDEGQSKDRIARLAVDLYADREDFR